MNIYIIKNDDSNRPIPFRIISSGEEMIPSRSIKNIDQFFFFETYGVRMTEYEIDNYIAHFTIWCHFLQSSSHDVCMVLEDGVNVSVTMEEILSEFSDDEDWDLFFPYDKLSKGSRATEMSASTLKYFWGSYFYFMRKNGARKMIECDTITQPVDEELLKKSLVGQINTYYFQTDWFEYDDTNSPSYITRNLSIKEAIFNHQAWTEETKKQAIDIMRYLSILAKEMDINMFLDAGTLLGAIRHGRIMPWDDDIDLAMNSRDIEKFVQEVERRGIVEHCTWVWGFTNQEYHKFWFKTGEKTKGFPYLFPFIDIWIFLEGENGEIYTCDGRTYHNQTYYPVRTVEFEGCELKLPNDYKGILDVKYPDWKTCIKVYPWSHRVKASAFKPLSLPIKVDKAGRFVH